MSNSVGSGNGGVLGYINSVGGGSSSGVSATPRGGAGGANSWFAAMSKAWGVTLDNQAGEIIELSNALGEGQNNPSQVAMLTAAAHEMAFLSQSAATSQNAAAEAINNIARKQ